MSDRPMSPVEQQVTVYLRSTMRVDPPTSLPVEVMRAVAVLPQERKPMFAAFGAFTPAIAAVVATALLIAAGAFVLAPREVGPSPAPPVTPTPAPTLTPEGARSLTQPGDVIRIPAIDSEGQFGMIRLERGDERASYEDYIPIAAMQAGEVFFVEVNVTYEIERATTDPYGNIDFGFAVDADRDGLDEDDVIWQHIGYSIDGAELATGPSPLLPFAGTGSTDISGWIAFELPLAGAEHDVYLVQLDDLPEPGPTFVAPTVLASALLREPAEPVGVTTYDPDDPPAIPEPSGPIPSLQALPTPIPSPNPTFEPLADAEADELFERLQTCTNTEIGVSLGFPASWHTNEAFEDLPACTLFSPDPIDAELVYEGLTTQMPPLSAIQRPAWFGGVTDQPNVPQAQFSLVPLADRVAWLISYPDPEVDSIAYLVPLTDDPYGPFMQMSARASSDARAVLERMLLHVEFEE